MGVWAFGRTGAPGKIRVHTQTPKRPSFLKKAAPFEMADGSENDDEPDATHHVYIITCSDGTYYTGYTTDVDRRVAEHNAGEGAKYTRGRTPVALVYTEAFASKAAAMQREYAIKQLRRPEKERLIRASETEGAT